MQCECGGHADELTGNSGDTRCVCVYVGLWLNVFLAGHCDGVKANVGASCTMFVVHMCMYYVVFRGLHSVHRVYRGHQIFVCDKAFPIC